MRVVLSFLAVIMTVVAVVPASAGSLQPAIQLSSEPTSVVETRLALAGDTAEPFNPERVLLQVLAQGVSVFNPTVADPKTPQLTFDVFLRSIVAARPFEAIGPMQAWSGMKQLEASSQELTSTVAREEADSEAVPNPEAEDAATDPVVWFEHPITWGPINIAGLQTEESVLGSPTRNLTPVPVPPAIVIGGGMLALLMLRRR